MTALKTLLADPTQDIAFVAELTYRDPDADTISTQRITTPNWEGTESGYLFGLLDNPGTREVSIGTDETGGVASELLNTLEFKNEPPSIGADGPLDFLRDKSLAERSITLLAGSPTEAISEYEEVGSGVADGEPTFDDDQRVMEVRRKSALERLSQDLDVNSYVGEPSALKMLTSTGVAAASDNAAHHLEEFTVAGRFWHPTVGSTFPYLHRRLSSSTADNWRVFLQSSASGTPGLMNARCSSGGVASAISLASLARVDDGDVHTFVFSRSDAHAYLMLDGVVQDEDNSPATPDLPTAGVQFGVNLHTGPGAILDLRLFDHYITADEMRAVMAVRAAGDEPGLVGLWRGDDATGGTLTDYSSTGADATISGTEDTDFEWVSSDLGDSAMAGQSMPTVFGRVFNFTADLVSAFFERFRFDDRDQEVSLNETVRDEGEELTGGGTDYSVESRQVLALTSEAGEPVTMGIASTSTQASFPQLLERILHTEWAGAAQTLTGRGPIDQETITSTGHAWTQQLTGLYHLSLFAGTWTRRRPVRQIVTELLRGTLTHLSLRRDALVEASALTPPVSPGPRNGHVAEFRGIFVNNVDANSRGAVVEWGSSAGALSGQDFTLALWVRDFRTPLVGGTSSLEGVLVDLSNDQESTTLDGVQLRWDHTFASKGLRLTHYDSSSGDTNVTLRTNTLTGDFGVWHFIAVVHDDTSGETRFYSAPKGGTLTLLGTKSDLSLSATPASQGVRVGGGGTQWGALAEPTVWDETRTLAELQSQMDDGLDGTETGLAFYAPLDGLSETSRTDTVNSVVGTASDFVQERPDLTVDLTQSPRPLRRRQMVPASRIEVKYRRNFSPLSDEQFAGTVAQDDKLELKAEWRSEAWEDSGVADDYLDSREVTIESPWYQSGGAQATLRLARERFAPGREFAELGADPSAPLRRGLLLEIGDEVRIIGHGDLADPGKTYRVVGNRALLDSLDAELRLWS